MLLPPPVCLLLLKAQYVLYERFSTESKVLLEATLARPDKKDAKVK